MHVNDVPAAAAGSRGVLRLSPEGFWWSLSNGLRLLLLSLCLDAGDRERRSNREAFLGSGSVWSKRDRFRGASSDMFHPRKD